MHMYTLHMYLYINVCVLCLCLSVQREQEEKRGGRVWWFVCSGAQRPRLVAYS